MNDRGKFFLPALNPSTFRPIAGSEETKKGSSLEKRTFSKVHLRLSFRKGEYGGSRFSVHRELLSVTVLTPLGIGKSCEIDRMSLYSRVTGHYGRNLPTTQPQFLYRPTKHEDLNLPCGLVNMIALHLLRDQTHVPLFKAYLLYKYNG
eukprot:TRINITY_DN6318_c0_g1_i1.p2 TRINITY_DN6318_c0_g1~~TRINITY_DN6318_c0_g1_i1.p2  ORF type:complete len:148 (+),score=14.46 TRINITY_DN6318_c0_g1_i1:258-701(+)